MADYVLVIQNAEHGHQAESLDLDQTHKLTIANAEHGHTATDYALSLPGVIRVSQWTPADAGAYAGQGQSVRVDFEAAFTEELESAYPTGQDFADGGTLTDAAIIGDELRLATATTGEDFEVPRHSDGAEITASNHWTKVSDNGACFIDNIIPSETNQYAAYQQYNTGGVYTFDDFGAAESNVDVRARIRFEDDNGDAGLAARVTGTGTSTRGYVCYLRAHDNQVSVARLNGAGGGSGTFGMATAAFTVVADQWYSFRFYVSGTWVAVKVWEEGNPEPVSWTIGKNDSTHAGPGAVGLRFQNGTANTIKQVDDFSATAVPPTYELAGSWLADPLELASVNRYSTSRITWEETTPTDTTVTVETRIDGGSWQTATSGSQIPGFTYDDFLAGAELEARVSLATTDNDVTPAVENLRLHFDPFNFDDLELIVDGLSATYANGRLALWGKRQVDTGVELDAWNDLHASAGGLRWYRNPADAGTIAAELRYNATSIETINFSGDDLPIGEDALPLFYYSFPNLPTESSPLENLFEWTAGDHDTLSNQGYEWILIDKGIAIRADAYYYVGHPTRVDLPSSLIAAHVALDDYLSSLLPEGYRRDDSPSSSLTQAYGRDDFPTSLLPAVVALEDFLSATIVAIGRLDDEPTSLVVYGVNRENVIEVHVISESTYNALTGEGLSWT